MNAWKVVEEVAELGLDILQAVRAGKTSVVEVRERLKDIVHPRRRDSSPEWEEALERKERELAEAERRRRQEEDTAETKIERHEPEGSSEQ